MKQARKWIFSVLFVIMALALVFAFAACGGSGDDVPSGDIPSEDEPQAGQTYGYGEQGTYYMDTSDGEYLLVMSSGVIVVSVGGDIGDMGTYTCDGSGAMTITFGSDTQTASYKDGAVTVNVQGTNYTFLLRTEYEVKFVSDADVTSVAVVNGRAAERPADPEKDGYAFLGWYEDSAYTVKYDFTTGITQDTTLYARFEKYSESGEFEITFMDGNTYLGTGSTIGGKVLEFPEEGSWWVSDTENGDKLTYKYTDEVLDENTTLFLNNSYAIGVSVTESGVHVENVMGNMSITIVSPDGRTTSNTFASSNYSYDFSSLSGGEYEVTVTYGTTSETAYYTNKALARASVFTVTDSRVLMWNEIEGAAYYTVSISCGSMSHTHEDIYVGTNRYYDFSDCDMPEGGIVFTVTAYADGYVSSTGSYTYFKGLDMAAVSVSGDVLTWTDVSGAMGYEIYIDGEYIGTTSMTSYSLKAYAPGTYRLSVKPVTHGYYSEETEYSYSKTSVASPGITSVEGGVISWNDVDGASYYAVMIDGVVVASSVSATSFAVSDQNLDGVLSVHTVSVRAIPGSGSQYTASEYSDPMSFTKDYMGSALTYSDGVITWQYSLDAAYYIVTVNNEDETLVYGQNSARITLTKSGDNEIAVKYVDADGNYSAAAQISVYAYAIIFDARGGVTLDESGNEIEVIYVAQGDTVYLPTPSFEAGSAEFGGWYTLPDLNYDENSLTYGGEGVLFADGSIFGQNGSLVLYASWTRISINARLNSGMGSLIDENGDEITMTQVAYGSSSYTLPVPVSSDAAYAFGGWYSQENGRGTQYTDQYGNASRTWTPSSEITLYAYWVQVLKFDLVMYQGQQVYTVSQGEGISYVTEITVPAYYNGVLVGTLDSAAFKSCSNLEVINLPDSILSIPTYNNGYSSGTGPFASSKNIQEVNIIPYEGNYERLYYSADGMLFYKNTLSGEVELLYCPYGRTSSSVVIPSTVSNEYETDYVYGQQVAVVRNVTSLATRVFYNHSELVSVTIPASVTNIDSQAFQSCSSLTDVIFLSDGSDAPLTLQENVFQSCSSLVTITLPSRLAQFEVSVFSSCKALTAVYVDGEGGTYSSTDDGLLCDTDGSRIIFCPAGRTGEISLTYSAVTSVGDEAFKSCTGITKLTVGRYISYIGESAFYSCTGLTELIFEGEGSVFTLTIAEKAFYNCTYLTEITLPENLVGLGQYAFGGCSRLVTVHYDSWEGATVSDLSGLKGDAFCTDSSSSTKKTSYLKTLYLGANVPGIDFGSIFGGSALASVIIEEENAAFAVEGNIVYSSDFTTLIYCPVAYSGSVTIVETVTAISDSAFYGCTGVTAVTFPSSLVSIGTYAFYGCTSITEIELNEGLISVGNYAFANCTALKTVSLPSTLVYLGAYDSTGNTLTSMAVFDSCSSLATITLGEGNMNFVVKDGILYLANTETVDGETAVVATELLLCPINNSIKEVVIPSTVTVIGSGAFQGNLTIESVGFENGIITGELTIGSNAFQGASNLKTIDLPVGLTEIGDDMFYQCYSLVNVTVPYTVTSVGKRAFYSCTSLEYVYFEPTPEDVEEVSLEFTGKTSLSAAGEFAYTDSLIYVNIPDRCTQISGYMFAYSGVQTVIIGAGVTEIPTYCFEYTTNLQTIQFGENEDSVSQLTSFSGNDAFYHSGGNFDLVLPEGFTTFYGYDFYGAEGLRSITIPSTVTKFTTQQFYECTNLEEVIFADGIDDVGGAEGTLKIEYMMFDGCTALKKIDIPSCITVIDGCGLYDCSSLTEVNILTNADGYSALKDIGRFAFGGSLITSFTFPDTDPDREDGGLITFSDSYGEIFRWCDYLSEVTLSNGVQKDLGYAMGQAVHLVKVNIGTCWAYELDESGNILYNTTTGDMALVIGDVGKEVTLPWGITSIEDFAFQYLNTLETVYIPTSVSSVGDYAFDGCTSLVNVIFYTADESERGLIEPAETMSFGLCCFRNCTALKEIEFSENATQFGTSLSSNGKQFLNCTSLEKVVLSSQTVRLGAYMFDGCSSLKIVTYTGDTEYGDGTGYASGYTRLPSTVKFVGNYCFRNTALTMAYIPAGATGTSTSSSATSGFGTYVYYGCTSLTTVVFEEGADTLNTYCFSGCTSLKSVTIPDTITSLPNYCFQNCSSLVEVNIPSSVTSLGTNCFQNCTSLESISLVSLTDSSLTSLPNYIFAGCSSLTQVSLPDNITTFGTYVFQDCSSLEYIDVSNITSFGNYSFDGCSSLKSFEFSETTETLGTYMFRNCTSLETVVLNGTYTELKNYIFNGCTSLKTIDIPDRITNLGTYAFQGCTALEEITLPESLNGVGTSATAWSTTGSAYTFDGCTSLKKVVLSSGLQGISGYVFRNCSSLKIVTYTGDPNYYPENDDYYMENGYFAIPSSMITVGMYSFAYSGIVTLTLPKLTATSGTSNGIGTNAFDGCKDLVNVTFDSSSTRMGEYMFIDCTSLVNVTIPASITQLGSYQFSGCTALEEVTFLGTGTTVSEGAFQGCTGLLEITLPSGAQSIGAYSFDGCTSLSLINLGDDITSIGNYAFRNCTSLTDITLPAFLEKIGNYAFTGSGVTDITIPQYVTSIGTAAFSGCTALSSIAVDEDNTAYTVIDGTMLADAEGTVISVLVSAGGEITLSGDRISSVAQDAFDGLVISTLTVSGIDIGSYAFEGATIYSVVIGADVSVIGDYAFYGVKGLASVTFAGDSAVETIGAYAFAGTDLMSLSLPASVSAVGDHAFDGISVTSISLDGTGLESVGTYAFANIGTLTSVEINCGATFAEGTFSGCTSLSSVTFGTNFTSGISDYMFSGCTSLTSVTIPSGTTEIGAHAFEGAALTSVTLPDSIVTVGDYAFNGMETLETVTWSTAIESVGAYAFAGTSISGFTAGESLSVIGDYAFYGCAKLEKIDLSAATYVTIGDYAFADCACLSEITFGETSVYIGDYAFENDTGVTSLFLNYETTVRIGVGAFSGWTENQTISTDTTKYLGAHKWMEWENKTTAGEPASELWLTGCDAQIIYQGDITG